MTEAKVVELLKEWKDEMRGVVADYNQLLGKLDDAVTLVNGQRKKWHERYKLPITLFALALLVILMAISMRATNTCKVSISTDKGISVESCTNTKK